MQMKIMQVMLIVAAILAAIGIAVALSKERIDTPRGEAREDQPSGLMNSFGSLLGPPTLSRDDLTDAGRPFPSSLRLTPGTNKTFRVAPGSPAQRRAGFRITGFSQPFTSTYKAHDDQQLDDWPKEDQPQVWGQSAAETSTEVRFVIFDKGGELTFRNRGDSSSTVTLRMEE